MIRSNRAAERLRVLTRNGRSQVEVVEEALDRMPDPVVRTQEEIDAAIAEIDALVRRIPPGSIPTMAEFDRMEYDENGDLR